MKNCFLSSLLFLILCSTAQAQGGYLFSELKGYSLFEGCTCTESDPVAIRISPQQDSVLVEYEQDVEGIVFLCGKATTLFKEIKEVKTSPTTLLIMGSSAPIFRLDLTKSSQQGDLIFRLSEDLRLDHEVKVVPMEE